MKLWSSIPAFWRLRLTVFLVGVLSLGTLLSIRLIHVQLVQGAEFQTLADDNRFYTLPIQAERGVFLDRYGDPLVWNTVRYYRITNPESLHQDLRPLSRLEALTLMATRSGSVVTTLERLYRYPESLSHVLGYVGAVTAQELESGRATSIQDRVGKLGLELSQNSQVRGKDGQEVYEINAIGQRQKLVTKVAAVPGTNVQTTLDPYLSQVAYLALDGKKGVVIISDAQTGEVLSLVNSPSFNANYLTRTAETETAESRRQLEIQKMFSDPRQLFFNRAIDGLYPPGSIFKLVTALAGLGEQKIDATTEVVDEGVLKVGEYEYGNWYFRQYGRTEGALSLVRAISRSNDIYFYKAAEWVGPENLAMMAKLFGFGQPTGIQLTPQAKGLVPDPAWKEQTLGERWYLGNTYHFGIGQGDLLVSPIQIAQMTSALGHQGTLCPPTLLESTTAKCVELGLKPEDIELVLQGMLGACSTGGTAFPFFPYNNTRRIEGNTVESDIAGGAVACKTGTAEFGAADANDHRRTHGWFTALVELNVDQLLAAQPTAATTADQTANVATPSALPTESSVATGLPDRSKWLEKIKTTGFPRRLVFVVLVESDEQLPFVEGSRDAAPVAKTVVDWMWGTQN